MNKQPTVAVLGLGAMGHAFAANLLKTGLATRVWNRTRWLDPAGAGSLMKLVVNAWLIAMMQGIAESTQLAAALGFSPDDLWNVLEDGPLAAPYVKGKLAMIKQDNYDPQMALVWGLKDARLALKAANSRNLPGLQRISEIWQQAVDAGHSESDISVVYRYLAP